jgi:hypothetical protein
LAKLFQENADPVARIPESDDEEMMANVSSDSEDGFNVSEEFKLGSIL